MKRLALAFALAGLLALPGSTLAFHHGGLPATTCADGSAVSPSNNNGRAKENLAKNPNGTPLPPAGSPGRSHLTSAPGNGAGQGELNCAAND